MLWQVLLTLLALLSTKVQILARSERGAAMRLASSLRHPCVTTYADVCGRMLTYAVAEMRLASSLRHPCVTTYADVC
jgi:hypothetical protein